MEPRDVSADPRPSSASLDRRVERLEVGLAETQRSVDRLEVGQSNLKEVVNLRFTAIDVAIATQGLGTAAVDRKIDDLKVYLQNLVTEGLKSAGDLEATPVGRLVNAQIKELKDGRLENARSIARVERKVVYATGVISTLLFLFSFFAPLIRHFVGLP